LRVLDLACGCAVKSLVLAQADATVHVTAMDRPEVLEVARDLARRLQVLPQATFTTGDILVDDFGVERYDAALLGQVSYYFTPTQNADLFRRIHEALTPGGVFVIDALMSSEPPSAEASLYTALLWAISGGAAHSFVVYRGWLEQVGFRQATQWGDRWLSAVK
jgi:SAM-dependent methyltransferase